MKEAAEFAESTQILMNVSEFTDVSQATDTLISAVQAFGYTAETSMNVVDLLNTIGNNYAISTADLAQSLTKSSASLVAAGGDLAEAAALTATANAIIQDADSVGTALKTTSLRLRGTSVKVLEEEGLDTDGAIESTSKLRSQVLATSGVDILTNTGAYKSTYQILLEIAEVWDEITDDKARAGLLELLAGKRNSSVIAALLQNPEDLKAAYEDAMNAEGSALKENERYLDSIQGKIDQFNNSLQAMWSDMLDSDMVKGFVAFGTEIIKVIDNIGLLGSALIAIGAYKGFGAIFDTLKASGITIDSITKKLGSYLFGIQATATAETKLTQVQLQKKLVNQGMLDDEAKDIVLKTGLGVATDKLTRETLEAALADKGYSAEKRQAILDEIFGVTVTEMSTGALIKKNIQQKLANSTLVQYAISMKLATAEEVANMTITQLLGLGFKGLTTAIWSATKAIAAFLFTNPVGWVILAIGAIAGGIAIFNHFHKTTEELTEELSELKSELQDIQSELESLNSELKTTEERMAELLAKDSLTFTEEEELENLKKQNDELQREIDLLKLKEKQKQKETAEKFVATMDSDVNSRAEYGQSGKKRKWYDWISPVTWGEGLVDAVLGTGIEDQVIKDKIEEYKKLQQEIAEQEDKILSSGGTNEKAKNKKEKLEKEASEIESFINSKTDEWAEMASGLEYGIDPETDKWLDYVNNLQDRWAILSGDTNAKSNAITRIFDKEEYTEASDTIDDLVKQLAEDPTDETILNKISEQCKLAEEDLLAVGLSVEDAKNYFTKLGQEANFATLGGKIKEVSKAATNFESLLKGNLFKVDGVDTGLADLFDEEGKIIQTKLSQVFNDTSDQTREDITRLLEGSYEQIKNGTVDTERLLTGFALKTTQQVLAIQTKVLGDQNLELFPNLKDEIDGIIDKFSEFSTAVGSVVDALDTLEQARAEEAYSGSVSIETLENLMKYTDDYTQLVEIDETGAIRLAADAEEILIGQRIEKIKTDAAAAVQTAQTNLEQAKYNAKAVNETGPVQKALTAATDGLAGAWAYLGSIIGDIGDGNFKGMFERASAAYGKVTAGREEKRTQVNVSVEDAEQALQKALDQQKIANALTADNIKSKYSSDEASGGNKTEDDVKDDAFQKEMDYWENRIGANQSRYEQLQNEIDLLEAKGQKADASYYQEQIALEKEREDLLLGQKQAAEDYLEMLEFAGLEGSEEWWEVANTLNDIESELDDVTASIVDLQDAIGEIDTYKFEEFNTRLDDITSKLGTLRDLIAPDGEEDWFDDEGNWTEEGVAVLGTYIQELETYKQGLAEAEDAYADYVKEYARNEKYYAKLGIHSEQELYDKRQELIEQQYDYAESINDTEQSIVDMYESSVDAIEEYTETLIDSYNDYIDSVKEALEAERDLYDFKKNVQKQSKDIATIERRIASLSGSTNASDIAERRKLEAELYESRESLNDTYYDHARSVQDEALDAEAQAYEETTTAMVEGIRTSLEEATRNMDEFLMGVTSMVMYNADTVLNKYEETNLPLTKELTNPWEQAKKAVGSYSGDALALMNKWTEKGGFFEQFNTTGTTNLKSPWSAGATAANAFKTSVDTVMDNVVDKIETNVQSAATQLSNLYQQILDTEARAAEAKVVVDNNNNNNNNNNQNYNDTPEKDVEPEVKLRGLMQTSKEMILGSKSFVDANTETINGVKYYRDSKTGYYYKISDLNSKRKYDGGRTTGWAIPKGTWFYTKHAKGTTGTPRDEWAITDEPQFGDELVLVPGKDGNLSFMRKGTGVVPADMTQKLFELAQIPTSDLMNKSLTAIVPNITKNDFKNEFNFESLVHVDTVDSDTLPKLEKMVDKKIDDFSRALNYSLKKFAR